MPSTVNGLLKTTGIELSGCAPWGETVKVAKSGIYIVSFSRDPSLNAGTAAGAPISRRTIEEWMKRAPDFELDGRKCPGVKDVIDRLKGFWLPDENIIYIGKTDRTLFERINEFYRTPLGIRAPHAGGHWIKTLEILNNSRVYYSVCSDPQVAEVKLLLAFEAGVSSSTKAALFDASALLPFGNLEVKYDGRRRAKAHGIGHCKA